MAHQRHAANAVAQYAGSSAVLSGVFAANGARKHEDTLPYLCCWRWRRLSQRGAPWYHPFAGGQRLRD